MFFKKKSEFLVYVVDDVKQQTDLLKAIVKAEFSAEVKTFSSADKALEAMEESGVLPSIVLCDQFMPGMNGLELRSTMRRKEYKVPVIIITGGEGENVVEEQLVMLSKPINRALLVGEMRRMLDKKFVPE